MQKLVQGFPEGTVLEGKVEAKATGTVLKKRDETQHSATGWGILAHNRGVGAWGSKKSRKKAHYPKNEARQGKR